MSITYSIKVHAATAIQWNGSWQNLGQSVVVFTTITSAWQRFTSRTIVPIMVYLGPNNRFLHSISNPILISNLMIRDSTILEVDSWVWGFRPMTPQFSLLKTPEMESLGTSQSRQGVTISEEPIWLMKCWRSIHLSAIHLQAWSVGQTGLEPYST